MILVTGGTGLVGSHLLGMLLGNGEKVRATCRATSKYGALKRVLAMYHPDAERAFNTIEWIIADITDIPALEKAFEGITNVYHCAALVSFDAREYRLQKKINIEGTANIVNLCLHHKVEKLCHVSSIAALGNNTDESLINETTDWNSEKDNSDYAISKHGAEMEVWRGSQEGLAVIIVQPGVILAPSHWYNGIGALLKRVENGLAKYPTGTSGFVGVKDVCIAMLGLMESSIKNEAFILVAENITFKSVLSLLAEAFKVSAPKAPLAKWKLMVLSKLDRLRSFMTNSAQKLPKALVLSLYGNDIYDGKKIESKTNFRYTPIKKIIHKMVIAFKVTR